MKYRLYIDESGDHASHDLDDISKRYLGLTGIIVEGENYRENFHPTLEALKQLHFPHSPDEPVILHRKKILNKAGHFWRLRDADKNLAFMKDLLSFFKIQSYAVITVVIDKKSHKERYGDSAYHPYHYCLTAMLERYCGFLKFRNSEGDVMAESRGGEEDSSLKAAYIDVVTRGTFYREADFFSKVLTSKNLKLKPKTANIAGLQACDLIAHPSKEEILLEERHISSVGSFGKEICGCLVAKYNSRFATGQIKGYGKIYLK